MNGRRALRVATRGSPLAILQTAKVVALIEGLPSRPRCETLVVRTTGDRLADAPIERIGGQGAFVKEVSAAVADGRADIAVHSAKDMPSAGQPGLVLAAVPERLDPRDALVGKRLEDLRPGATVATGSARRRAQLAWLRPDLTFCELRGNMARRVEVAETVGAGVLAAAALERLGLGARVTEVLEPATLLPQVGQGALAVECRESDTETIELLGAIDDTAAHAALRAERAFLASLGGGCSLPCGALAVQRERAVAPHGALAPPGGEMDGLVIEGMLASRDGHVLLRRRCSGEDPAELGSRLATELVEQAGGRFAGDWGAP
ncbi:MAG TPA: hydroxymethylbilane synthase [Acidimicrobiales bacterium]|nr:hydroxymethylbilane synthase [Acidimicrobiales bacterium]